ncbi:MAG: SDR family oxidoreductase [Sphingobacteriales bacterium]|nr:SDR family oxidoreductase [Sphingobacteriales bacterium]
MSQLQNNLVIITGAGSGIGRALTLQAASEGAKVIACDVNESSLDETLELAQGKPEKYMLDVADSAQIERFAVDIIQKHPDDEIILINNAGVGLTSGTFTETPLEDFEWLMNINLWGVVRMTKAFLPHLLQQNKGHIVNISSVFGLAGMPTNSAYCTAKFGVKGFTDVLKAELMQTNVKVSSVHPGGIKTNIARNSRISATQDVKEAKALMAKFEKEALKMPPEKAAAVIIKGIRKDEPRILIGNDAKALDWIVRMFPNTYHKVIAKVFKV